MRKTCELATCTRPMRRQGLCSLHYQRWKRTGSPHLPSRVEVLWTQFERADNGCWRWLGYVSKDGYGRRGDWWAHRIFYELLVEPIPDGMEVDHLCRNRSCVNPSHMEVVTHAENMRRGARVRPRQTHCKRGHPLPPKGQCLPCQRIRRAAAKAKPLAGESVANESPAAVVAAPGS